MVNYDDVLDAQDKLRAFRCAVAKLPRKTTALQYLATIETQLQRDIIKARNGELLIIARQSERQFRAMVRAAEKNLGKKTR